MTIQFTRNGRKAMLWAQVEAMRRGEEYVEPTHLMLGVLHGEDTGALRLIHRLGISVSAIREIVTTMLPTVTLGARAEQSTLSPEARQILEQARRETEVTGHDWVGSEHLLLSLLHDSPDTLTDLNLTYGAVIQAVAAGFSEASLLEIAPSVIGHPGFLKGRHFISVLDLDPNEVEALFELTRAVKLGHVEPVAKGKNVALLFDKPSLRTKVSFQVGVSRLGGNSVYLSKEEVGLGKRETVKDVARVLSRMVDAVVIRTFSHDDMVEFARYSDVPTINALDDFEHPCQALADFYTIREHRAQTHGQKLVFLGDGNNVAISLMLLAPVLGTHFTLACPPGYEPPAAVVKHAQELASRFGTQFEIVHDPIKASDDADVLYSDVWTSMGQEEESKKRLKDFAGYAIDEKTLREAKEDALILHCLPAHRGEEITDDAMESPQSKVFDQAENRLHVQQALLAAVL